MRLPFKVSALAFLTLIAGGPTSASTDPQSGTWTDVGDMTVKRENAAAAILPDGRVLVTGGSDPSGALAETEMYALDQGFHQAAPMMVPRSGHTAVTLADGRVLVTGGVTTGGLSTDSAEIYDPFADAWRTLPATMAERRAGHTTTLLRDGRVLIAAGDDAGAISSSLELFDPLSETFSWAGVLSAPRKLHAATLLADGRVLIAGGFDGNITLASIDLYDPATGWVTFDLMTAARAGLSATTLLDGTVLLAGGHSNAGDLASTEVYDPTWGTFVAGGSLTVARSGHVAFLLPRNNSVLIAGGTRAGTPLVTSELFVPWRNRSAPTGMLAMPHAGAVGVPLGIEGWSLVAGGRGVATGEVYHFATVTTDKDDYPPGSVVTISGQGWVPGEIVTLSFREVPEFDQPPTVIAVADGNGDIVNTDFSPDGDDIGIRFYLTASGSVSEAQMTFTDARTINSVTLNGAASVSVSSAASITAVVNATNTGGSNWRSTGWRIATTAPGTMTCLDHTNHDGNGSYSETFSVTGPVADGTYNAYFAIYANETCSSGASATYTLTNGVVVDGPATVTSIVRAAGSPTAAASLSWTVTFSESVTGLDASDFALASSGLGGTPAITGVSGSGASYTVTASTGSGSGTLGLNLVDDDSVVDSTSNKLGGTGTSGAGDGSFTGEAYTLDRTSPAVSSINLAVASPSAASSVTWTVTLSESVTGVDTTDFSLAASGLSGPPAITGVTGSGATYTVTASTGSASGTLGLNLVDDDSMVDGLSNQLGGAGTSGAGDGSSTGQVYTIDRTAPAVTNVTASAADGTYGLAAVIPVQVTFSEAVTVTGTPRITLETGSSDAVVNYSSGSGTATLTFNYTVASGHIASDLDYVATTSLALNSGTIKDALANNATLTLAAPGAAGSLGTNKAIVVDTVAPTVTNVTSSTANGSYTVGAVISVQVTFDKALTVTGTPQLTLETGSSNAVVDYTSGSGTSSLTFAYTVATGHTSADLNYTATNSLKLNGGTVQDTYNNTATLTLPALAGANALKANKDLVIDTAASTVSDVTSSTANGTYGTSAAISIQMAFSEAVTVTGAPQLTLETGASDALVNYASGSGTSTLTFTYTVAVGHTSADLEYASTSALALNGGTIRDTAGNDATLTLPALASTNSLGGNKALVVDTTPPVVTSVTSSLTADGTYGTGDAIAVQVTFNESVTVTGSPQLTLETGSSDAVVNYTSGSGTTILRFNYTVAVGHTSADLDYGSTTALALNGGTIKDAGNNSATLILAAPGAAGSLGANKALVVDGVAPTVTNVTSSAADGTYGTGSVIPVQVTFSEAVTVTGTPRLTLETGGSTNVNYTSGNGTATLTFAYTVAAGDTTADLDYVATTSLSAGTIRDAATNNATLTLAAPGAAGSLGANKAIVVDALAPTVTNVTSSTANGSYTVGTVISVQITFDKTLAVTGTPQLTLETGSSDAVVNYASGSGTSTLTFAYTVASGHTSADLNYTATSALALNGGTIKDTYNNTATLTLPALNGANALKANKDIVIDTTAPTLTNVTSSTANGTYGTAAVISIQATVSEAVTVTGTPQVTLETGASDGVVNYTSGSGTSTLTFTYTVAAGHSSADLEYASTSALAFNGGTIKDTAGNDAAVTLPALATTSSLGGNKALVVDAVAPTVTNVTSSTANGTSIAGNTISVQVTFSKSVTVTGTPQLTLETGTSDAVVNYASGSGTATLTFSYTVAAGHESSDLDYVSTAALALNGGSIKDTVANSPNNATLTLAAPGGAGSLGANKSLVVDAVSPAVVSITRVAASPTNASSLSWTVIFSEGVTGVNSSDFSPSTTGLSGSPAISSVVGSGTTYTVTASTGTGSGTFGLNLVDDDTVVDAALNKLGGTGAGNGNFAGELYTLDRTLTPTITAASKVYDATTSAVISSRGFTSNLAVTENVSVTGGTATFATKSVGTGKTVTANTLSLTGVDAAKYVLASTSATTTADVTAAALTMSGVAASNKPYDGNATASLATGSAALVGVVGSDTLTLSTGSASGTFADAAVGVGKLVTVAGLTIGGADAGNYTLAQPTTSASITAKPLTVSGITASSRAFDGTAAATLATGGAALVGVVGNETVTLSTASASGTFADAAIGVGKQVTVTGLTIGGADAGKYTLTQPTTTATITGKELTVSGITASDRAFDGTVAANLETGSAALIGVGGGDTVTLSTASASGTFADAAVGIGKLVTVTGLTIGGADAGNYTLTQPTTTADITDETTSEAGNEAPSNEAVDTDTVTLNTSIPTGTSANQTIDLAAITQGAVTTGAGSNSQVNSESPSVAKPPVRVTRNASSLASRDIGSKSAVTGSFKSADTSVTGGSNSPEGGSVPPSLPDSCMTVTADAQTKVSGAPDPDLTYQSSGGNLTWREAITGTLTRLPGEDAGIYPIQQGTLTAGNNCMTFAGADLTVIKADQTISISGVPTSPLEWGPYAIDASATSGLAVSLKTTGACSISGGMLLIAGPGRCTVTATQSGDDRYSRAPEVEQSFVTEVSWSNALKSIKVDGSSVFRIGSTIPVSFQLTGAPAGITGLVAKLYVSRISNNILGPEMAAVSSTAAGGNTFVYDPARRQYVFDLRPSATGMSQGRWQVRVDLGDGVSHTAIFSVTN